MVVLEHELQEHLGDDWSFQSYYGSAGTGYGICRVADGGCFNPTMVVLELFTIGNALIGGVFQSYYGSAGTIVKCHTPVFSGVSILLW